MYLIISADQDTTEIVIKYMVYVHFSSVAQLRPTLCHLMNCSTPGLPVRHQLPESIQTSVLPMNTQDWSPLGWTG